MFYWIKNSVSMLLLIFSCAAVAQEFSLKIYVDRCGNPDPYGKPFQQYFSSGALHDDIIISIGGRKCYFRYELYFEGIRRRRLDVVNWETEKGLSGIQLNFAVDNSLEALAGNIRNINDCGSTSDPGTADFEQSIITRLLELKTPPEIVKYLLGKNIITAKNSGWLILFLQMCPEWPPEAAEFLKKLYTSSDTNVHAVRDRIVRVSVKNPAMAEWLKPRMAEFAATRKRQLSGMSACTAAAYMAISGDSDPVSVVSNYVTDPTGFIYEYAYATGKYNDACSLIDKIQAGWSTRPGIMRDYAMLYDQSDLSRQNRIMLLKRFLCRGNIQISFRNDYALMQTIEVTDPATKDFLKKARLLHPDNLPALMEITRDKDYAANAWLALKTFPASAMPPDVAAQCFVRCEQDLRSSDADIRKTAIWNMRLFNTDALRPKAVKLLFSLQLSNDPSEVFMANDSFAALGPACLSELLAAVSGSDPYFAVRACELIGNMGLYGQKAAPELLKQLNVTQDWMLKSMIIKALMLIKAVDAIPEIQKFTDAGQPMLASTATQALVLLKPKGKIK